MPSVPGGGDPLEQTSGVDSSKQIDGEVTFVVLPTANRSDDLKCAQQWLADNSLLGAWVDADGKPNAKILVIAHRMAARRLGFEGLYDAFHGSSSLSTAFDEGRAWPLTPLRDALLPLAHAALHSRQDLIPLLMRANPGLRERAAAPGGTKAFLADASAAVAKLVDSIAAGGSGSVGETLRIAESGGIVELDSRLRDALYAPESDAFAALDKRLRDTLTAFVECDITEVARYMSYLETESPYATQQGIKGAEFPDVIVVLDDEEANYTMFSYDKLLKLKPPSKTDLEHQAAGEDTVYARTWRLLYVCASRARRALAVILFAVDVDSGVAALTASGLPGTENVVTLQAMSS